MSYESRQKFGNGILKVTYPDYAPVVVLDEIYQRNPDWQPRRKTHFYNSYTLDEVLQHHPEFEEVKEILAGMIMGEELFFDEHMMLRDSHHEHAHVWKVKLVPTFMVSTGIKPRWDDYGQGYSTSTPDRISHDKFMTMLADQLEDKTNRVYITSVDWSTNSYGEFAFVYFWDAGNGVGFCAYGYGWHNIQGWKRDWSLYTQHSRLTTHVLNRRRHEAQLSLLHSIMMENQPNDYGRAMLQPPPKKERTAEQKAHAFLEELLDADGAMIELEDNPGIINLFEDDEDGLF